MKKKLLVINFILTLTISMFCLALIPPVDAASGTGSWITSYSIEDATTGQLIYEEDFDSGTSSGSGTIMSGVQLKVTATIDISVNNPSSKLNLATGMSHSSKDHYWEHDSDDGYDLGNYNPNSASFSFSQTSGTLTITCFGVASGSTETNVNGITLHNAIPLSLISLKDPSGSLLDEIRFDIVDDTIEEYNRMLSDRQTDLENLRSSGVAAGYVDIYSNVIDQSQVVADQGLTDSAISMLEGLANSSAPAGAVMEMLFIPLIVVMGVIAGLLAFMFFRVKGKVGYMQLVVEDQIRDLEGLTLRASKIDRAFSYNLESVKERLKNLVGM